MKREVESKNTYGVRPYSSESGASRSGAICEVGKSPVKSAFVLSRTDTCAAKCTHAKGESEEGHARRGELVADVELAHD